MASTPPVSPSLSPLDPTFGPGVGSQDGFESNDPAAVDPIVVAVGNRTPTPSTAGFSSEDYLESEHLGSRSVSLNPTDPTTVKMRANRHSFLNLPAILAPLTKISDWVNDVKIFWDSLQIHDAETTADSAIQLINAPFQFLYSLATFSHYISTFIPHLLKFLQLEFLTFLTPFTSIFGFAICFFEGIFETLNYQREVEFRQDFWYVSKELMLIDQEPDINKKISQFNRLHQWVQDNQAKFSTVSDDLPLILSLFAQVKTELILSDQNGNNPFISAAWQTLQSTILKQTLNWLQFTYLELTEEEKRKIQTPINILGSDYDPQQITDAQKDEIEKAIKILAKLERKEISEYSPEQITEAQKEKIRVASESLALLPRKVALVRRIGSWPTKELPQRIQEAFAYFKSGEEQGDMTNAIQFTQEHVISVLDRQSTKKLWIHKVGIIAVIITIVGLVLSATVFGFSPFVPLSIILIGMGIGIVRYILSTALLESSHWNLKWNEAVPNFICAIPQKVAMKAREIAMKIHALKPAFLTALDCG